MGGVAAISVIAKNGPDPNTAEGLILQINPSGNKPIVAGTYNALGATDFFVGGTWALGVNSVVYGAGLLLDTANPLQIVVSAIDDKTIKGSFKGDFFFTDAAGGTTDASRKKSFSDGEFYVKFQ